jgi:hypothetical protein
LFALGWGVRFGYFFFGRRNDEEEKYVGPYVKKPFENKPEQVIPRTVFNISGFLLGIFGCSVS